MSRAVKLSGKKNLPLQTTLSTKEDPHPHTEPNPYILSTFGQKSFR